MKTLVLNIIITLAIGINLHAATFPNRYVTNTDSVAIQFNRLKLTNTLTYFVATTGNDSNAGTNASFPLLTIQAAVNNALTWDFDTNNIVIQVADGSYSGSVLVQGMVANTDWKDSQGTLFIHGNDASPSNVIVTNATTNHLIMASKGSTVILGSLCVGSTNLANLNLLDTQIGSTLVGSNIVIGPVTPGNPQIVSEINSHFYLKGSATVTGAGTNFVLVLGPSDVWITSNITFTGSPAYTGPIFKAINGGGIYIFGASFSGTVTGVKYSVFNAGSIATLGNGSPDATLPGTLPGSAGLGLTEGATNVFFGTYQLAASGPVGAIDASAGVAGIVGQFTNKIIPFSSATNLINNVTTNIVTLTLPPGDWDVDGAVSFTFTSATVGETKAGITTTSSTIPVDGTAVLSGVQTTALSTSDSITVPRIRINTAIQTNVFLVGDAVFSAGTVVGYGQISARRVR